MRRIDAHEQVEVSVVIDGRRESTSVDARTNLADMARDLGATSVRVGCEQGVCGSCTVLLDDVSVRSCLVLAVQADGSRIETLTGIAGRIDELRQAFARHFAIEKRVQGVVALFRQKLEEFGWQGDAIAARQRDRLVDRAERARHEHRLVVMACQVPVHGDGGLHARIIANGVAVAPVVLLVPVADSTHRW